MKIIVASTNPIKVNAVKEILEDYKNFLGASIISVKASSGVSHQPKSLQETVEGARNRAKNAFKDCDYSIGIESGLMQVPHTKSGYMDVTACAIFDGRKFHLGLSSAFEYPKKMTELVLKEGIEIDEAATKADFTKNPDIGNAEGMIGLLTNGRLKRKEYTKQALLTALIHLENPEHY